MEGRAVSLLRPYPRPMHDHWPGEYRFCPMCAAELELRPMGGRSRQVCPDCDFVHWRNPGVGAAVLIRDEAGRVLLIERGPNASQSGLWAVPAGFVDYGEDVREAARRELLEETGLEATIGEVAYVASNFHDPNKLTVGIWFHGRVTGGTLMAGDDASDAGYFPLDDLPPLAFSSDLEFFARLARQDAGGQDPDQSGGNRT